VGFFSGLTWALARRTRSSPGYHIGGLQPRTQGSDLSPNEISKMAESGREFIPQGAGGEWIMLRECPEFSDPATSKSPPRTLFAARGQAPLYTQAASGGKDGKDPQISIDADSGRRASPRSDAGLNPRKSASSADMVRFKGGETPEIAEWGVGHDW